MTERISEILEVLTLVRGSSAGYVTRRAVRDRRLAALKEVARRRGIAPETVRDKFGRQLQPEVPGVDEFDRLLEAWLSGRPDELRSVLLKHAGDFADEQRIREFFSTQSTAAGRAAG